MGIGSRYHFALSPRHYDAKKLTTRRASLVRLLAVRTTYSGQLTFNFKR